MCNLLGAAGSSAGKGRRGRRALGSEVCSRGGVSDRRRGARNQMLKCSPKLQPLLSLTVGKPPYHRHLRFMLYHVLDFSFLFPPPTYLPSPKKARFHDGHPESAVEGRSEPTARWHRSARAPPGPCRAETGRAEPGHPGPGSAAPPDTRRPPRRGKRKPLPELSLFLLPALFSVSTGDRACLP